MTADSLPNTYLIMEKQEDLIPLAQALSNDDFDTASEVSEAYCYKSRTPSSTSGLQSFYHTCSYVRCGLGQLVSLLTPTSFHHMLTPQSTSTQSTSLHPTAYLDGMRGLAAFAVFLCHLSYTTWDIGHTYMAGEGDQKLQNSSLLRLPIVRLFYSGPPMVAIFFIISGYSLSYKPLKQMRNGDFDGLLKTLTSAAFRRPFRLFLPCFISTLIVVLLTRLGLYQYTEDFANNMPGIHEGHYWTAPDTTTQLLDWAHKMLEFVNPFEWGLFAGSIDLDLHLWTIPVEFRCSMALFITQLIVARMTTKARLATLAILMTWGTYSNRWEMVPFWTGIAIAELDMMRTASKPLLLSEKSQEVATSNLGREYRQSFINCTLFIIGLYLASYPDAEGHLSPGYVFLTSLIPERYTEKHRFFPNIGAAMIVFSVGRLEWAKKIFTTRLIQWLGAISFPLYVCHGFVIHTFGYALMDWLYEATKAWDSEVRFKQSFMLAATCTVLLTLAVSDIFLRVVDVRTVKFARFLEGRVLR